MRALVLESVRRLAIRDMVLDEPLGPRDVRIELHTVGICGSDVHYFTHGRIGPFVVREPMVLGHEASGTITETGEAVTDLRPGDRVCMEPGLPDPSSRASRLGLYNLDPAVRFWATPPVHGVLRPSVVHPAAFTFRLPDNVSFAEGAMVEPFAVGMQAAAKAEIRPGDTALVFGAGPIGIMTALAALAGGCARVLISDMAQSKLDIASGYENVLCVNSRREDLGAKVAEATGGWGVDVVFECSGAPQVWNGIAGLLRPAGRIVAVGLPVDPVPCDIAHLSTREIRIDTVFRYANQYQRAITLIASGSVKLEPLVADTYPFEDAVAAFERAAEGRPDDIKIQIRMQ